MSKNKNQERESEVRREEQGLDRRLFLGSAMLAGAAVAACATGGSSEEEVSTEHPGERMEPGPQQAPEGETLRAGLVGCGGRGTGAAIDFLNAGPGLEVIALADVFQDRVDSTRQKLKEEKGTEIPDENIFVGFDGYQKVIDSGIDIVLLATPPHFRPEHFEAAVNARKHVFMEKPLAVDPVGVRAILQAAERADAFGLSVVTGTQRRHQKSYIETYNRIVDGMIGSIVAARCYWNQDQLWFHRPQPDWSDMEYMIRDWVNWNWLSGDHIVEQHIHNIDVVNWFTGTHPVRAVGMGGRARRVTGDQYDFFDVDFEMENGVHVHSMCRQIDGCANNVSEFIVGERGSSNCRDTIFDARGQVAWKYGEGRETEEDNSPYVQEHIDLVTSIRKGNPVNETLATAISTLTAIMGRISAYSGQETTWEAMMQSDLRLGPETYAMGPVDIEATVPVPGRESSQS